MIIGNIQNLEEYSFLEEKIKTCFSYAEKCDLLSYETGSYAIEGEKLFVNIVKYATTAAENRIWEAHKKYLDVHLILSGKEQIDLNFIQNMDNGEFVEGEDFLPLQGKKKTSVVLESGDFLICYPSDGHRTAVAVEESQPVKKAIFKVLI